MSIGEPTIAKNFPTSAKLILKLNKRFENLNPSSREPDPHFEEEDFLRIQHLHDTILWINKNLDDIDREERTQNNKNETSSKNVLL